MKQLLDKQNVEFEEKIVWVPNYLKPEDAEKMDNDLKSIILSQKIELLEKVVEIVEERKWILPIIGEVGDKIPEGYNWALDDILSTLQETIKEIK